LYGSHLRHSYSILQQAIRHLQVGFTPVTSVQEFCWKYVFSHLFRAISNFQQNSRTLLWNRLWTLKFVFSWQCLESDDYRQKFTGQLSRGVARSCQSTWVGMYGRVCRKLILESLNRESTVWSWQWAVWTQRQGQGQNKPNAVACKSGTLYC
jgi:hypothetical protein